jgi:integrase
MARKSEWRDREMRDGIRKVRNARLSKEAGKDVYSFKVPYRDANNKQTSETFTTHAAALRFRNKIRRQRDEGLGIDPKAGMISVAEYAAIWLKRAEVKREGTYTLYSNHLRLHILPVLGGRQLRAVARDDVQGLVNALHARGLAPRTIQTIYVTLAALFRSAYLLDKRLTASPCVKVALPEIPDREFQIPSVAEVRALANGMPARYRTVVLVAAGTGLRISEVMGLTWDRIDLEARTIKVDRQMTPRTILGPPKTRRSNRVVPMPEMVRAALTQHREEFPSIAQDIALTGGSIARGVELVFVRANGKPANSRDVRRVFQFARARAGLSDEVVFHTLRHFYASIQIAAGTSLTALRDRMGHGTIQITSDIYGHLLPAEDDRTRAAIDNAFTDPDDGTPVAA